MKIKIICFGKMDSKFFKDAADTYIKWLKKFCDLEIIELTENVNAEIEVNKKINCELLQQKIDVNKNFETFIMDIHSKEVSSEQFSKLIDNNKSFKSGKLQFIIGPSDGFTNDFKSKYNKISFGPITLPHQLFRVILLEQIYRAFKIINNEKYHK